ncbi:MAG: bifunctional phosphoribosylaminoimidazolecarboxamide formyltransferase/IMP cyclohydrolase [Clostridiales bacterium]|jgi:phosphoribosylaminoimidazolecarboxamide formyltransferase/IMP cyclohydrolase|nr:bifunctional phosphoribosylaminoimidazolecarboxamide formyltransferase/IMP cyclohydrolase [Clostridiales bacterium]
MKKRALISVSDKTGVVEFAGGLAALGYEIISTGGTSAALETAGIKIINISDLTGFPECLDGRVKTLHPAVHAGLLAVRSNKGHMAQLEKLSINTIDVVAVNLYPFKKAISDPGCTLGHAVENIDIGGPTMLRSAAKNYQDVAVICDPRDYGEILDKLGKGGLDGEYRLRLMYKVFAHTAEYDSLISDYLRKRVGVRYPEHITFAYEKAQELRYGENPHQNAAFYKECFPYPGAVTDAVQLHGKELSYNNIADANGALDILREFSEPCAVAVKHSNPCGVAVAETVAEAFRRANAADPISIFGGIIAVNRPVDAETAEEISKIFIEIVIAPDFSEAALEILTKKPNLRLLKLASIPAPLKPETAEMKKVLGGLLIQDRDTALYGEQDIRYVTKRKPTKAELKELRFAYTLVKHTKSNAIVVAKDGASVGIGTGQTNRIWAARQAIEHGGANVRGAVMASDAFFPFPDCAEAAVAAGITAIIQPGGAKADAESIAVCDKHGIAMIFVGVRHFKH